jgi:SAM-dependent methyltransferase
MTYPLESIDPFYAACLKLSAPPCEEEPYRPIYVRLPRAPITGSPVPHLTSLYHFHRAGEYGDRKWPGNCGGNLIRDLLTYFKPEGLVFDPMSGSGTARDVCKELGIPCVAWDIHQGFDACDPKDFPPAETFDFIWAHPPYWRVKLYADDPRDLSRAPTLEHFLKRFGQFIRNCNGVLKSGGKLAILIGDPANDREMGYVPLVYHTKRLAFATGLQQHCTDIIRFSHGATSSKKVYRTSFIPMLHDVCMIFEKAN